MHILGPARHCVFGPGELFRGEETSPSKLQTDDLYQLVMVGDG